MLVFASYELTAGQLTQASKISSWVPLQKVISTDDCVVQNFTEL